MRCKHRYLKNDKILPAYKDSSKNIIYEKTGENTYLPLFDDKFREFTLEKY
jgi:hypothetical protein